MHGISCRAISSVESEQIVASDEYLSSSRRGRGGSILSSVARLVVSLSSEKANSFTPIKTTLVRNIYGDRPQLRPCAA